MAAIGLFTATGGGGRPPARPGPGPGPDPAVIACKISGYPGRILVWPGDTPAGELPGDAQLAGGFWVALRVD